MTGDINVRINEIREDFTRALYEPHYMAIFREIKSLRVKLEKAQRTQQTLKLDLHAIEQAKAICIKYRTSSWYEEDESHTMSEPITKAIKLACRKTLADHGRSIKVLQYRVERLSTELFEHIYMSLKLMGHPTTKTTKLAVHKLMKYG